MVGSASKHHMSANLKSIAELPAIQTTSYKASSTLAQKSSVSATSGQVMTDQSAKYQKSDSLIYVTDSSVITFQKSSSICRNSKNSADEKTTDKSSSNSDSSAPSSKQVMTDSAIKSRKSPSPAHDLRLQQSKHLLVLLHQASEVHPHVQALLQSIQMLDISSPLSRVMSRQICSVARRQLIRRLLICSPQIQAVHQAQNES